MKKIPLLLTAFIAVILIIGIFGLREALPTSCEDQCQTEYYKCKRAVDKSVLTPEEVRQKYRACKARRQNCLNRCNQNSQDSSNIPTRDR